jgi:hypothetical protein
MFMQVNELSLREDGKKQGLAPVYTMDLGSKDPRARVVWRARSNFFTQTRLIWDPLRK